MYSIVALSCTRGKQTTKTETTTLGMEVETQTQTNALLLPLSQGYENKKEWPPHLVRRSMADIASNQQAKAYGPDYVAMPATVFLHLPRLFSETACGLVSHDPVKGDIFHLNASIRALEGQCRDGALMRLLGVWQADYFRCSSRTD